MGKKRALKKGTTVPLAQQLHTDAFAQPTARKKARLVKTDELEGVTEVPEKLLAAARKQLADDDGYKMPSGGAGLDFPRLGDITAEDEDSSEGEEPEDTGSVCESLRLGPEDERAMALFLKPSTGERKTLADLVQEKLRERQTEIETQFSEATGVHSAKLHPNVIELYQGVRNVLSRYRSGKMPKAFKIIPSLSNWEQILFITEPDQWSAAAMFQATRLFASNLNAKMAQRYYNLVLLPRIRDDITEYKQLNFHLYAALKKSLYKPAAFFKGILLPLCQDGDCTLREAAIISSVLAKHSIPMLHSAAAMLKIAEMSYTGANSIFLQVLLRKKYALPYRVIDALVGHFITFRSEKRQLPVLWHQSLLAFVENYREDIAVEQRDALLELLHHQKHDGITPEVRRLLQSAKSRDEEGDEFAAAVMDFDL